MVSSMVRSLGYLVASSIDLELVDCDATLLKEGVCRTARGRRRLRHLRSPAYAYGRGRLQGKPAIVITKACQDIHLTARVSGFSPGTDNSFSVLPTKNATGNWVKVVQRLPVELTVDRVPTDVPLHPGLSVEASVDTGHRSRLFGHDTPANTRTQVGGQSW
jgi:hypothetical protein